MKQAKSTDVSSYGIELGPFGTFTLRRVFPWKINGKLAGYVELGEEIEHITPNLKEILHVEVIFVIEKNFLDRKRWEEGQEMMGRQGNWELFDRYAVIDSTIKPIPEDMIKAIEGRTGSIEDFNVGNNSYRGAAIPLRDVAGKVLGEMVVLRNITQEKEWRQRTIAVVSLGGTSIMVVLSMFFYLYLGHIENVLEKTQKNALSNALRYKTLFDASRDAIMTLVPPDWKFDSGNPATIEMFRAKDENEFISKGPGEMSPKFQPDGVLSEEKSKMTIQQAMEEGTSFFEWTHKRFDGENFCATVLLTRVEIVKGKIFLQATVRDITDRKKAEKLKKDAEEMKLKFIAIASHELRSPLAVIKGGLDIVVDELTGKLNDKQKEILGRIKKNVDRLTRLSTDVLDFSEIETKKMNFDFQKNNLNKVIDDVYKIVYALAEQKGLYLHLSLDKEISEFMFDEDRIIQVLINIITNSLKAVEKGGITITSAKERNMVKVTVKDTGLGIRKNDMEKLFKSFSRIEDKNYEKARGTGLGLAICREIIIGHNGKMWAESEYGEGAAFIFTLPIV